MHTHFNRKIKVPNNRRFFPQPWLPRWHFSWLEIERGGSRLGARCRRRLRAPDSGQGFHATAGRVPASAVRRCDLEPRVLDPSSNFAREARRIRSRLSPHRTKAFRPIFASSRARFRGRKWVLAVSRPVWKQKITIKRKIKKVTKNTCFLTLNKNKIRNQV